MEGGKAQGHIPELRREEIHQEDFPHEAFPFPGTYTIELRLTPRIFIRNHEGTFQLNQLSDGERRLFSLFVDIARQLSLTPEKEAIGTAQAIVLIDEIDVHLHPKWQRRIVPELEHLFPNCQFIATTHSPFIIQSVDRNKILQLGERKDAAFRGSNNSIEDIIEEIQDIRMPQRSFRAERLSRAATRYFSLLQRGKDAPAQELHKAEIEYREASEPFTSKPALHALLKIELLKNK